MKRRPLGPVLAWSIAFALGCSHEQGPPPAPPPSAAAPQPTPPSAVAEQVGGGPVAVYGASVYSPGQEIYKALRQEDSLMAFLACQGEPDRLEVLENPGAAPRIILEYSRAGLARHGTVEIAPSAAGYYAAQPIDPSGVLKAAAPKKRSEPATKPSPAAKSKPRPATAPAQPEPPAAETRPEPARPQPTPTQLDTCPIEPWRADCRAACVPGATWEWCSDRK
jgi:hypothetical protein